MEAVVVFAPKSEINIFRKKLRINFDWPQSEENFPKSLILVLEVIALISHSILLCKKDSYIVVTGKYCACFY